MFTKKSKLLNELSIYNSEFDEISARHLLLEDDDDDALAADTARYNEFLGSSGDFVKQLIGMIKELMGLFGFNPGEAQEIADAMLKPENLNKLKPMSDDLYADIEAGMLDRVLDAENAADLNAAVLAEFKAYKLEQDIVINGENGKTYTLKAGTVVDLTKMEGFQDRFDAFMEPYTGTEAAFEELRDSAVTVKLEEVIASVKANDFEDLAKDLAQQAIEKAALSEPAPKTMEELKTAVEKILADPEQEFTVNGVEGVSLDALDLGALELKAVKDAVITEASAKIDKTIEDAKGLGVTESALVARTTMSARANQEYDYDKILDDRKITLDELKKDLEVGGPMSKILYKAGGRDAIETAGYMINRLEETGVDISQIEVSEQFKDAVVRAKTDQLVSGKDAVQAAMDTDVSELAATIANKDAGRMRVVMGGFSDAAYNDFENNGAPLDKVLNELSNLYGESVVDPTGTARNTANGLAEARNPIPDKTFTLQETIDLTRQGIAKLDNYEGRTLTDAQARELLRGNGPALMAYESYSTYAVNNNHRSNGPRMIEADRVAFLMEQSVEDLEKVAERMGPTAAQNFEMPTSHAMATYEAYSNGRIGQDSPEMTEARGEINLQNAYQQRRDAETRRTDGRTANVRNRAERSAMDELANKGERYGKRGARRVKELEMEGPGGQIVGEVLESGVEVVTDVLRAVPTRRTSEEIMDRRARREMMDNVYGFHDKSGAEGVYKAQAAAEVQEQEDKIVGDLRDAMQHDGFNTAYNDPAVAQQMQDVREKMEEIEELAEKDGNQFTNGRKHRQMERLLEEFETELSEAVAALGNSGAMIADDSYKATMTALEQAKAGRAPK